MHRSRFRGPLVLGSALLVLITVAVFLTGQTRPSMDAARFNDRGELIRPQGYREWVFVGTPLTPNDLSLQLRKRGIDNVILGGMSANLCVESHLRELLEQGFEVAVVKDATAAAVTPELGDGYAAALVNFGFLANHTVTTGEAVQAIRGA